uniref:Sulfotransferase n=1 Tax=Fundidesulfovibrio putealis TaxID=270496 RepID=A0A7C3WA40_9BACT
MKFVLLSSARSGTSALITALMSHPDVLMHGEIFHQNIEMHINAQVLERLDVSKRESDPVGFVRDLLEVDLGKAAVGFKIWKSQSPEAVEYLINAPDVRLMLLERENKLAHYSSRQLAIQTNVWNTGNVRMFEQKVTMPFDEEFFRKFRRYDDMLFDYYRQAIATSGKECLYLTYQDHILPRRWDMVLEYLGLPPFPVDTPLVKMHSKSIVDRFDPQDREAVLACLEDIGRPEWATEDGRAG